MNLRSMSLLSRCRQNNHGSFTFFSPVLFVHVCPVANDSTAKNMLTHRLSSSFTHRFLLLSFTFSFLLLITICLCLPFFLPPLAFQGNNFYMVLQQICSLADVSHIHKSPSKKAPNPARSRMNALSTFDVALAVHFKIFFLAQHKCLDEIQGW